MPSPAALNQTVATTGISVTEENERAKAAGSPAIAAMTASATDTAILPVGAHQAEARKRIESIAAWIGRPEGHGQLVPVAPECDVEREVKTWEADGTLGTRRVRILKLLGSGLAGTVFLAQDEHGTRFIEKHYGEIPAAGSKKLGRKLTALLFTLFRQAPLSFRELPAAVISSHLANRFIVAASRARFGRAMTPPILYTRYEPQTGGYVQAFTFVEGRPLRPWDVGLPLLGEAGVFFKQMQRWRDFLAKELGFWGLARQVDPANPNSFSNVWVTPDNYVLLLDVVPGVPGFLEARYLVWGALRGQLPPFGDAIDFGRLARYLQKHPLEPLSAWQRDLETLRAATQHWQNSEPRLPSSPLRLWRVLRDPQVKAATRRATLTHLEVKGAISARQAGEYREIFARTGKFPKFLRHTLLKMAPLPLHRALTDGQYLWRVLRGGWRLPLRLVSGVLRRAGKLVSSILRTLGTAGRLLVNRQERMTRCRAEVGNWIDQEQGLGRMTERQARRLREALQNDNEIADIVNLFALHLLIGAAGESLLGPSGSFLLGAAIMSQNWWLAVPALIEPALRFFAVISVGLGRHLGLLVFSALPTVGSLAAPLYLLHRRPELGGFMLRSFGRKVALKIPGFGERGSLCEMLGVAAAQVLLVDPARFLPPVLVALMVGVVMHQGWLVAASVGVYTLVVVWMLLTRRREARRYATRLFQPMSSGDIDPLPNTPWVLGMPEPMSKRNPNAEFSEDGASTIFGRNRF